MAIHRHVKTGGLYSVLGIGEICSQYPLYDHMVCALLRDRNTGKLRIVPAPVNPADISPRFSLAGPLMIQCAEALKDGESAVVYSNTATGQQYGRPQAEFNDGRFQPPWEPADDDRPATMSPALGAPYGDKPKPRVHAAVAAHKIVDTILRDLLVQVFENDPKVEELFLGYGPKAFEFAVKVLNGDTEMPVDMPAFHVGSSVRKTGGDYRFEGTVVAVFPKLSGQVRYVVEDDRGVLHVYSVKNLAPHGQSFSHTVKFPVVTK